MKKLLSVLLALCLLLSLVGCLSIQQPSVDTTQSITTQPTVTTGETLPDGPVILPTQSSADAGQSTQNPLDVQQDLLEAWLAGQQTPSTAATQATETTTAGVEDDRERPTQDDRQENSATSAIETTVSEPAATYWQSPTETTTAATQPHANTTEVSTTQPQATATEISTTQTTTTESPTTQAAEDTPYLDPNGTYKTMEEVALYLHLYGRLPSNYITKTQAKSQYGSIRSIPKTMNIGGDRFYNEEGLLPAGRTYYECDIGTSGGSNRGAKRIVFSSNGWIYYTANHYGSFTLLYEGS